MHRSHVLAALSCFVEALITATTYSYLASFLGCIGGFMILLGGHRTSLIYLPASVFSICMVLVHGRILQILWPWNEPYDDWTYQRSVVEVVLNFLGIFMCFTLLCCSLVAITAIPPTKPSPHRVSPNSNDVPVIINNPSGRLTSPRSQQYPAVVTECYCVTASPNVYVLKQLPPGTVLPPGTISPANITYGQTVTLPQQVHCAIPQIPTSPRPMPSPTSSVSPTLTSGVPLTQMMKSQEGDIGNKNN